LLCAEIPICEQTRAIRFGWEEYNAKWGGEIKAVPDISFGEFPDITESSGVQGFLHRVSRGN
jgi:hypothetical protein